ncbi:M1 family metallopeptidase [Nocardioides acrostichi]|uniref:Aminopeptidase N n=1 Tax=Nocardioides acrostichi TaxID=2784339 RepID=A0A930Y6S2_9ACTN|nr:M1 family metallopeptidase [Nocardioides acrostichi]MBF4161287.1 M1 family metallopeptidase [Nocardioides acrostichi]
MTTPRRLGAGTLALAVATAPLLASGAAVAGAPDTLFPDQGNAAIDVLKYQVKMDYRPVLNSAEATVQILAEAEEPLDQVVLDYAGADVTSVQVDHQPATFSQSDDHLVITPGESTPVGAGRFTVQIGWSGTPPDYTDADGSTEGWVQTSDGAIALGEPLGAMTWLPSSNTPGDKARWRVLVKVPRGFTAVSNGKLVKQRDTTTQSTFIWRSQQPMAPFLATLAIGRFSEDHSTFKGSDGHRITVREYADAGIGQAQKPQMSAQQAIEFLQPFFGPYPFSDAGSIVDDADVGYALETQTRPFYPPGAASKSTVIHETAHQWFGDSVGIIDWHDLWLAEGFATYAEWLYSAKTGGKTPHQHFAENYAKPADDSLWSPAPTEFTDPADLFGEPVYTRGAMTLQMLRERVGAKDFFRIVRRWAALHEHGTVRTATFERLAQRVSGKKLGHLFDDWLRKDGKPTGW